MSSIPRPDGGRLVSDIEGALGALVASRWPGAELVSVTSVAPDRGTRGDRTDGGMGGSHSVRAVVRHAGGDVEDLVLRAATPDDLGHDRRADRAQRMLLSYDTFADVPGHAPAVDVGVVTGDGSLRPVGEGEYYLITRFVPGAPYADDLRRLASGEPLGARDLARCDLLAEYLADLHRRPAERPALYTRSIREVLGSDGGVFGIIDGFPEGAPAAPPARLHALERACAEWRWRLRGREHRGVRVHGDFQPLNILFDDHGVDGGAGELALVDASRGARGDPADDVCCLALYYVLFALSRPKVWEPAFRPLWKRFWERYLALSGDRELCDAAPLFVAWRALDFASPVRHPKLGERERDALLKLAERALAVSRFEPEWAEELFS